MTIVERCGTWASNGLAFSEFFFVAEYRYATSIARAVGAVSPGTTAGELPGDQRVTVTGAFNVPPGTSIDQILLRDPKGKSLAVWIAG